MSKKKKTKSETVVKDRETKSLEVVEKKKHPLRKLIFAVLLLLLSFVLFLSTMLFRLDAWHEFDANKILGTERSTIIFDSDNNEISVQYNLQNRIWVSIDEIPEIVRYAFISAEDARFYEHIGIDLIRIAGAAIEDIKQGGYVQGASTITQQLIKLSHLNPEKTMTRKVEEAVLAYQMEQQFSKDEILEMYLNYVYFGGGLYGIEAAARGYFGIGASELSAGQAAMLAGILKSPSQYAPHLDYEASTKRRNTILGLMNEYGHLSDEDLTKEKAKKEEICYVKNEDKVNNCYVDTVITEACEILDVTKEELFSGGYRIYTALDSDLQSKCEEVFADDSMFPNNEVQGAAIIIKPKTSMICAMIGERDSKTHTAFGFNRATDIKRQPGSVIKPIIAYAPALEFFGYTAATVIDDTQKDYNGYQPKNSGDKYNGKVTLRKAITSSLNIPAVEVLNDIGVKSGISFAESVGIEFEESDRNLSIALGGFTYGVSPLQVAGAYSAFACGGTYAKPACVTAITDQFGGVIYSHTISRTRVMSSANAYILTSMLQSVVTEGTGRRLGESSIPLAGKTGTVEEVGSSGGNRDAWMACYNSEYSAAAWIGYDSAKEGKAMPKSATGGNFPALILRTLFEYIYKEDTPPQFDVPDNIVSIRLDRHSLESDHIAALATVLTPTDGSIYEVFVRGTEPKVSGEYWQIPSPPHDLVCTMDGGHLMLSFTPINEYTIYKLCRSDVHGNVVILAEFSGRELINPDGRFTYIDATAQEGVHLEYYVIPVHPELMINGMAVTGPASPKVVVVITKTA